jgi:hypothetical protein
MHADSALMSHNYAEHREPCALFARAPPLSLLHLLLQTCMRLFDSSFDPADSPVVYLPGWDSVPLTELSPIPLYHCYTSYCNATDIS